MGGRSGTGASGSGGVTVASLNRARITGMSPRELSAAWKSTFGRDLTSTTEVHDLLGLTSQSLGDSGSISMSGGRFGMALRAQVIASKFVLDRKFRSGEAVHESLFVHEEHKGKGIAQSILKRATDSYQRLGIKSISLTAAADGRYVWPKMGFRVSEKAMGEYREGFTAHLRAQGIEPPRKIHSVNQIARTMHNGKAVGKEYLLSRRAPTNQDMSIRTSRLARYLKKD